MIDDLLKEPCLMPHDGSDPRFSVNPGNIYGNLVSCTGAQFCGLAVIETKNNAESLAKELEKRVSTPRPLRIHWTGCPNSCGQVQAADIGLMGGPAKKEINGKMKAVPGVKMFVGGTIGEHGKLQLDTHTEGIPIEDLVPHLVDTIVNDFGGHVRPEFADEHAAWQKAQAEAKAAEEAET